MNNFDRQESRPRAPPGLLPDSAQLIQIRIEAAVEAAVIAFTDESAHAYHMTSLIGCIACDIVPIVF